MDVYGINSLKGFLYQIKVFVDNVIENITVCDIVFEGNDDIECMKKDDFFYAHTIPSEWGTQLIQVKNGKLNQAILFKIILNWLKLDVNETTKHILVYSQDYVFQEKEVLKDNFLKYFRNINMQSCNSNKLCKIVFNKYSENGVLNEEFLGKDLAMIIDDLIKNKKLLSNEIIAQSEYDNYTKTYCSDMRSERAKWKRLEMLIRLIETELMNAIEKGESYKMQFSDFNAMNSKATQQVTDESYQPEYSLFKKDKSTDEKVNKLFNSKKREVSQLEKIRLSKQNIMKHLTYELFYRDIREVYISDRLEQVETLELMALDNFECNELECKGDEIRLFNTVMKSPDLKNKDIILNSLSTKGCYVHLSSEEADVDKQISWSKCDE